MVCGLGSNISVLRFSSKVGVLFVGVEVCIFRVMLKRCTLVK